MGKPKSIKDLSDVKYALSDSQRKYVPILVIDDEEFDYLDHLKRNGFDIKHSKDIDSIESVLAFEIILCDIKGVGKKFGSKHEGAHIISEIRRLYPFKTIIAYTAYQHDPSINKYLLLADYVFKKDIDGDEWLEKLDEAIEKSTNLIHRWKKIRNYLIDKELPIYDISMLENEYVSALTKGQNIKNFPKERTKKKFSGDIRAVLQSFTASILFKLIIGN